MATSISATTRTEPFRGPSPADAAAPRAESAPTKWGAGLPYLAGVDGLRAIAVLAVILYHSQQLSFVPGGFLGVEVFFVISGYLITSLLHREVRRSGKVDLRRFWARRARRLLPALLLLLVTAVAYSLVFLPGSVAGLRGDVTAALGYSTNWYLIFSEQSYFEAIGRPPMLRHLWSLAIEEQFYLVWPLICAALFTALRRRRHAAVAILLAAAVGSNLLMQMLFDPGSDPSRVYYGTDTRASGLLAGAALALVWSPARLRRNISGTARGIIDCAGVVGLLALGALFWRVDELSSFTYRWAFGLTALVTAVLIAVAVHPASRVGDLLGARWLRWVGLRSYGLYLWHWPVFVVTRPDIDLPAGWATPVTLALRLGITVVLAELSFRLVEMPIREGALGRLRRRYGAAWGRQRTRYQWRLRGAGVVLTALLVTLGVGLVSAEEEVPELLRSTGGRTEMGITPGDLNIPPTTVPPTTTAPASTPTDPLLTSGTGAEVTTTTALPTTTVPGLPPVTAIGDSVMLGAARTLGETIPGVHVNAGVGYQGADVLSIARFLHDTGLMGPTVVIHVGTNGTVTANQLNDLMTLLADRERVIVVNVHVPRSWEGEVNALLASEIPKYPNATLVDWSAVATAHLDLFGDDGVHVGPSGARLYADLIAAAIPG